MPHSTPSTRRAGQCTQRHSMHRAGAFGPARNNSRVAVETSCRALGTAACHRLWRFYRARRLAPARTQSRFTRQRASERPRVLGSKSAIWHGCCSVPRQVASPFAIAALAGRCLPTARSDRSRATGCNWRQLAMRATRKPEKSPAASGTPHIRRRALHSLADRTPGKSAGDPRQENTDSGIQRQPAMDMSRH